MGPTAELPADPTKQLGRGEAIYRRTIAGFDRVVRIYMCDAARDAVGNIEAAMAELKELEAARAADADNDNIVALRAAE